MLMSRKGFVGSALAFCAIPGVSVGVSAPSPMGKGRERLRFGVISDVHVFSGADIPSKKDATYVEKAFACFRDRKVDAVVVAGDISEHGLRSQLLEVGNTWRKVFPDNRRPDGTSVEKLFVCGNHDRDGWSYNGKGRLAKEIGLERANAAFSEGNRICADYEAAWREAFDEPFEDFWIKDVKGFKFVGNQHLQYLKGDTFLEEHRRELEGDRPFFYIQHMHPQGTCSAPWTWGQDSGFSTAALSKFPNAIAFSGHSHTPLTDDRTLWQGAFTSVGTASLRYLLPFGGRENAFPYGAVDPKTSQMPELGRDVQHGMIVTVFDGYVEIERLDFHNGLSLGSNWIVPIPAERPMTFESRASTAPVPQFAGNAKIGTSVRRGKDRAGNECEQVVVTFPPANDGRVRAFDYEVSVEVLDVDVEKTWQVKRVYSPGAFRGISADNEIVSCVFGKAELPMNYVDKKGRTFASPRFGRKYRFVVSPCNCWGKKGNPLYGNWN